MKSMTGFGHAELKTPEGIIRVELKTTNHKFLEIAARLPLHLTEYEDLIRRIVSREIRRGKIAAFVFAPDPAESASRLAMNEPLAREVHRAVKRLRHVLNLHAQPSAEFELGEVMRFPGVLTKEVAPERRSAFTPNLERAVHEALKDLTRSRVQEGSALAKDFRRRIEEIRRALAVIEKRLPALEKEYRASLHAKVREFLKDSEMDRERLTLDVAQYVKSSDISEEITRMKSHLAALDKTLSEAGEIGRKIDFMGQEMVREANTMGSKSSDVGIANAVIQIKSAIEKIREQSQNVE